MHIDKVEMLLRIIGQCDLADVSLKVPVDEKMYELFGERKSFVPKDIRYINLLKPGSLPDQKEIADGIATEFLDAAAKLVKEGEPFATPLRKEWREPVLVWKLMK
jgi:hypothetical protein